MCRQVNNKTYLTGSLSGNLLNLWVFWVLRQPSTAHDLAWTIFLNPNQIFKKTGEIIKETYVLLQWSRNSQWRPVAEQAKSYFHKLSRIKFKILKTALLVKDGGRDDQFKLTNLIEHHFELYLDRFRHFKTRNVVSVFFAVLLPPCRSLRARAF